MNDIWRFIFAGMLGFSLLVLFKNWEEYTAQPPAERLDGSPAASAPGAIPASGDSDLPTPTQSLTATGEEDAPPTVTPTGDDGRKIKVETDWLSAVISEAGGSLIEVRLKKHLQDDTPLPLLEDDSRRYIAQSGVIGGDNAPNHNSRFRAAAGLQSPLTLPSGVDSLTVDLHADSGGLALTKRYVFSRSSYLVSVVLIAENKSDHAKDWFGYFQLAHDGALPRDYSSILPTFFGAAMFTEQDKFIKVAFDDIGDSSYPKKSDNGWIGIIQRYFAAVWLPPAALEREFFIRRVKDGGARVGFIAPFGALPPGEQKTVAARLFAGAQEQRILNTLDEQKDAPGIHLVVDYGWLTFIAVLLFKLMVFIQSFFNNWGVSIILLTVAIKAMFYPLSSAAYRSMAKIKEEAPRIKQLQEKFGDDKKRLQQEIMSVYREKKINPLGGCLPILVQIPVFIALYWVLLGSVELRQAPFALWIQDLSTPDPFFILPVTMGIAMYLQTRMSPAPPDPTQAMIMRLMPIGFSIFSIFFPSGLVLYWVVNTVLSIAQQWHITRRLRAATGSR